MCRTWIACVHLYYCFRSRCSKASPRSRSCGQVDASVGFLAPSNAAAALRSNAAGRSTARRCACTDSVTCSMRLQVTMYSIVLLIDARLCQWVSHQLPSSCQCSPTVASCQRKKSLWVHAPFPVNVEHLRLIELSTSETLL